MNCSDFEKNIEAFVKGGLHAMKLKTMKEHCAKCPSCMRLAKANRFIIDALDETEQVGAPKGLADTILAAVGAEELYSLAETDSISHGIVESKTIECRDFEKYAAAFVEGNQDSKLSHVMEEHRAVCPACARTARAHRFIYASLDNAEPVRAPEGLADTILAAVEAEAVQEAKPGEKTVPYFNPGELVSGLAVGGLLIAAYIFSAGDLVKNSAGLAGWSERLHAVWTDLFRVSRWEELSGIWLQFIPIYNEITEFYTETILPLTEKISHLFSVAVQIPYTAQTVPLYYIAALVIVMLSTWSYFKPFDTSVVSAQSNHFRHS